MNYFLKSILNSSLIEERKRNKFWEWLLLQVRLLIKRRKRVLGFTNPSLMQYLIGTYEERCLFLVNYEKRCWKVEDKNMVLLEIGLLSVPPGI